MKQSETDLVRNLQSRVRDHFGSKKPEEVVRGSQELILVPEQIDGLDLPGIAQLGPVLMHPKPRPVPLNAYLACALTNLEANDRMLIAHLSDIVSMVCQSVDIDLYEPRKKTDPVHHPDVKDKEVFHIDRDRVTGSDLLIHLTHFPSTGSGEELSFAYDALVPIVLIRHREKTVSRMITGIPVFQVEIVYGEPEEMREQLEARLCAIRPLLEQRRLARRELSQNVVGARIRELRLESSLSRHQLAEAVSVSEGQVESWEENVDAISNPSLTHLRLVATALRTTVAELVNPDYTESVISGIQAILDDRVADVAAARFRGVPRRDHKALIRRLLIRLLNFLENEGR